MAAFLKLLIEFDAGKIEPAAILDQGQGLRGLTWQDMSVEAVGDPESAKASACVSSQTRAVDHCIEGLFFRC